MALHYMKQSMGEAPAKRLSSALARVRHHRDVLEACQTSAFPEGPQVMDPRGHSHPSSSPWPALPAGSS